MPQNDTIYLIVEDDGAVERSASDEWFDTEMAAKTGRDAIVEARVDSRHQEAMKRYDAAVAARDLAQRQFAVLVEAGLETGKFNRPEPRRPVRDDDRGYRAYLEESLGVTSATRHINTDDRTS